MLERRRASRRQTATQEPLSRIRLRTGKELDVVDLSSVGALVEGVVRLLPGTHVDAHLVTRDGRVLVRTLIVRAEVFSLGPPALVYRSALGFERAIDATPPGYVVPGGHELQPVPRGRSYPDDPVGISAERLERPEERAFPGSASPWHRDW